MIVEAGWTHAECYIGSLLTKTLEELVEYSYMSVTIFRVDISRPGVNKILSRLFAHYQSIQ